MNILVCDDSKPSIAIITKHLRFYEKENSLSFCIHEYSSSSEAIKCPVKIDIAILDIEMPGEMNGIELGKALRHQNNPHMVLMYESAYKKYVDDAMDLGIIRFFDKPIVSERLFKGIEKAVQIIDETTTPLYLRAESDIKSVQIKDIVMIEIEHRSTIVYTKTGEYHSTKNIKYWNDTLKQSYFTTPHKSYIINLFFITDYSRNSITLDNRFTVAIAHKKQGEFRRLYYSFMEGR